MSPRPRRAMITLVVLHLLTGCCVCSPSACAESQVCCVSHVAAPCGVSQLTCTCHPSPHEPWARTCCKCAMVVPRRVDVTSFPPKLHLHCVAPIPDRSAVPGQARSEPVHAGYTPDGRVRLHLAQCVLLI